MLPGVTVWLVISHVTGGYIVTMLLWITVWHVIAHVTGAYIMVCHCLCCRWLLCGMLLPMLLGVTLWHVIAHVAGGYSLACCIAVLSQFVETPCSVVQQCVTFSPVCCNVLWRSSSNRGHNLSLLFGGESICPE